MRVVLLAVVVVSVVAAGVSCKEPMTGVEAPDVDRTLTTHSYIEEGNLVTFIVDTRATGIRAGDNFIPLEIAVANRGLKNLTITRESFQLIDEDGNRYHVASPQELIANYEFLDWDRRLSELPGIVDQRLAVYHRYRSKLTPTREFDVSGVVQDQVDLPQWGYLIDFIYFPTPKTGVENRKFELFLETPELPDPVFVKFVVRS